MTDEQKDSFCTKRPMTKEEYEARQSVIRRVLDPETGRTRCVKSLLSLIWFLCISDWNLIIFSKCEQEKEITWNNIFTNLFQDILMCGLLRTHFWKSDSGLTTLDWILPLSQAMFNVNTSDIVCRKQAKCLWKNKVVLIWSASRAEMYCSIYCTPLLIETGRDSNME